MEDHAKAVACIASQVSSFYQQKTPFRLYHGSTNTTQQRNFNPRKVVDTSRLNHVLSIDAKNMTCLVEPNVAMDELVDATLPHGCIPPVVMEFPGITVGGGFAGTAGESSGFKYGFFDRIVNWIEIVLPNGEVVKASPQERGDLFRGAAGSFGTLGVTTLLELQLIKSAEYVELTYNLAHSTSEALSIMDLVAKDEANDFVDGIQFSLDKTVIISGRLTNEIPGGVRLQRFGRAIDPWFYVHVDRTTKRSSGRQLKEIAPIKDYLFRYDRGAFWTGRYAFQYFLVPFNRITRWALDYFMHTRVMYHALHASGHASKYIVQDVLIPRDGLEEFVEFVSTEFGFWPLWLCPMELGEEISLHPDVKRSKTTGVSFVNVGVWGPGSTDYPKFVEQNRQLEHKVRSLGGIKWLYAQAFYTEEEFWSIYDRKWYDSLREKYHATYLPDVHQKVGVNLQKVLSRPDSVTGWARRALWHVWPVSGVYGVLKTLLEREYLLAK